MRHFFELLLILVYSLLILMVMETTANQQLGYAQMSKIADEIRDAMKGRLCTDVSQASALPK